MAILSETKRVGSFDRYQRLVLELEEVASDLNLRLSAVVKPPTPEAVDNTTAAESSGMSALNNRMAASLAQLRNLAQRIDL